MRICFIPIDNRPVCYNLTEDIVSIDGSIEILLPPRGLLGDLTKSADVQGLLEWLESCPKSDAIILSLDTIAYGGLIPSRRTTETFEEIKSRVEYLKRLLEEKEAEVYAFSSIMRISNNNYNEEEKEYWKDYGKKIFEYSYNYSKNISQDCITPPQPFPSSEGVPQEILDDYICTRKRNFEINKLYLEWQKAGLFNTLIFSKDDCAEFGFNVEEAKELERLGAKTKTGADEIPLSLLSRAIEKDIKVYVEYTEPDCKDLISNYEDVSIEKSVLGQLELGGFKVVESVEEADVVLLVNNFREKQGELVMGWDTQGKYTGPLVMPSIPYCVADVRYANGADNNFVKQLLPQIELENFYGYAGWNTSANTLGSLLSALKVRFNAEKYNEDGFKRLQLIRFLDDWAYQANVRAQIKEPCDISELMKPFEQQLLNHPTLTLPVQRGDYSFPWNRKFEVEIILPSPLMGEGPEGG